MDVLSLSWFCMLGASVRELPPPLVQALGWTIVHALWQGALIALLLALGLAALRRKPAYVRYRLAVGAQLLALIAAVATFVLLYQTDKPMYNSPETLLYAFSAPAYATPAGESASWKHNLYLLTAFFDRNIAFITAVWLLGVGLFTLRLLGAWTYTRRLAKLSVQPVPLHWQQRFQALAQALHATETAALLESALVHTPIVIGHLKPVVLLPLGLLSGLPPEQVEALLAHELAHIRRRDYLVNLLLSLLETLFFFHPAIWWIGTTIRREREYCCDEAAVACSGNSLAYAKALSALPKQHSGLHLLAMAANGNPKELLHRIRRILLQQPSYQSDTMEKTIATLLIAGSVFFFSLQAQPTETAAHPEKERLIALDTLPQGRIRIQQKKDGKSISAELQNGRILSLKVDGQDVPKEEFNRYEGQVHELLEKLPPAPPTPPTPPAPPRPGMGFFFGTDDLEERDIVILQDGDDSTRIERHFRFDDGPGAAFRGFSFRLGEAPEEIARRMEEIAERLAERGELSEETAKRMEELAKRRGEWSEENAKRMEELAERLAEQGTRFRMDIDKDRLGSLRLQLEKGILDGLIPLQELEGLRELEFDFDWQEGPDPRPAPEAEALGIFPSPRNRRMSAQQQIERALLRDELVEPNAKYKFELSDRSLKVNGEKMPEALRKKYLRLYEQASGIAWESGNKVVIHTDAGK